MFTSEMAESCQQCITIQDIEQCALQQLIDFAYTAKIKLNVENVQSLLYASSILQVCTLHVFCISKYSSCTH